MVQLATDLLPSTSASDLISQISSLDVGVKRVDDPAEMGQRIGEQLSSVRREVASLLPAGPYPVEVMRSSWDQDTALLNNGVALKVMYQADAVRTPPMMQYVSDLASVGANIRIVRRQVHRIMIFDRRVVFVAVKADTTDLPYLMISEPALVRSLCNQFAADWRVAHSIGITAEDVLDYERVREVLRVLATGATDESAARQLGVSDRTIRRRVAAVMELLGATSRFEAGVKAVETGWL